MAENSVRMSGIDISTHQSGIDISATGADFVIVKATEGSGYVDPDFHRHAQATINAGKLLGLYHFSWNSANSIEEEVNTFVDAVRPYLNQAILILDWEDKDGVYDVGFAQAWLEQVEARTGITPIIYMSASVANAYSWERVAAKYWLWVAGYPGWAPDYLDTPDCPYAPLGHGWWVLMWQYTDEGRVPGYGGNVDLNVFYRSDYKWKSLADPNHYNTDGDDLDMSENTDLLREIRNALRYGKANSHPAGDVIWALDDIRVNTQKALAAQEALKAEVAEIKSSLAKGNALEK